MYFAIDLWTLFWVLIGGGLFFFVRKKIRFSLPALILPEISHLQNESQAMKSKFIFSSENAMKISFCLFLLALLDPQIRDWQKTPETERQLPREGAAVYLVLDQSSSMGSPETSTKIKELYQFPSKLNILKGFVKEFISHRPQDLIGLVSFARTAKVLSPLTLDHKNVLQELEKLQVVSEKNQDGSGIGYAIFKTASLASATKQLTKEEKGEPSSYQIRDMAIVLVTDGVQEIHPEDIEKRLRSIDIEEAARYAKEQNVRVYLVLISQEMEKEKFDSYRKMLQRSAEITGGHFFLTPNARSLEEIFAGIEKLEKSIVPMEIQESLISFRRYSFYPMLIVFGLFFLFTAVFLETIVIRRIP